MVTSLEMGNAEVSMFGVGEDLKFMRVPKRELQRRA